jgi:hypothetical protein
MTVLFAAMQASCGRADPATVVIEMRKVARVDDCHVSLDLIRYYKDGSPLGDFRFVCGVPESALRDEKWWGEQSPPLMNSMLVGDCMRLKKTWYCVEKIQPGEWATIKPTFRTIDSDVTLIERMK